MEFLDYLRTLAALSVAGVTIAVVSLVVESVRLARLDAARRRALEDHRYGYGERKWWM